MVCRNTDAYLNAYHNWSCDNIITINQSEHPNTAYLPNVNIGQHKLPLNTVAVYHSTPLRCTCGLGTFLFAAWVKMKGKDKKGRSEKKAVKKIYLPIPLKIFKK